MDLRDYQSAALELARGHALDGRRGCIIVAPTGSGKTRLAGEIISRALLKGSRILFLAHLRVLVEQAAGHFVGRGFPTGVIMGGIPRNPALPLQVATPHSWDSLDTKPPADLVFIDEAHHAESPRYTRVLEAYPDAFLVGLTATPQQSLANIFDSDAHPITTLELVDRNVLVPGRYFALQGASFEREDGQIMVDAGNLVSHWLRLGENRRTLVFSSRVEHSRAVAAAFLAQGVPALHVDAATSRRERDAAHQKLVNGELRVISNCGIYLEGYDNPAVSALVLARTAKTKATYIQICGRGLRAFPGKRDCIILDMCGNYDMYGPAEGYMPKLDIAEGAEPSVEGYRTCQACWRIFEAYRTRCPECGTRYIPVKRGMPEMSDVCLREVPPEEVEREARKKLILLEGLRHAKTLQDFQNLAEELGYKPGWAHIRWNLRNGHPPRHSHRF